MASNIPDRPDRPGSPHPAQSRKQKTVHEFKDLVAISIYLAFFFCALATYSHGAAEKVRLSTSTTPSRSSTLSSSPKSSSSETMAHLGRKAETKTALPDHPLQVIPVHPVRRRLPLPRGVRQARHPSRAFRNRLAQHPLGRAGLPEASSSSRVFIPLFAFRELRRVIGEDTLLRPLPRPRHRKHHQLNLPGEAIIRCGKNPPPKATFP